MRHVCEHCNQKYAIPDARVAGKVLKVRCKRCSGVMQVDGSHVSASAPSDEPEAREWFVAISGQAQGPYTRTQVLELVERGEVRERTLLWRPGMEAWRRAQLGGNLQFVLDAVHAREQAADEESYRAPTGVFESVPSGMVMDQGAYFPDPTLHTGWTVLSEEARVYLESVVHREAEHRSERWRRVALSSLVVAALSLAGAAGAWAASLM
ncbi:MAG: GYF domain-containing protein [Myxococcota bacterium]